MLLREPLSSFEIEEATIGAVHAAILDGRLTAVQLVQAYLDRIAAFNGRCVGGEVDPQTGLLLGTIEPIENAGQLGALLTINIRGKRSLTDPVDDDPRMPDALEVAEALDHAFRKTGKLSGPLHGIPFAIKDQFDTFDMRTTSGAMTAYDNDRPPQDAEVVARLRAAGAIILAKANMGEFAAGDRSTAGASPCNPYDTSRSAGRSSGGSSAAVAANLVMCALGEETGPSARNPAANCGLVAIVATHSLVSRHGIIPASLTRDRPGVLCRTVADAAIVLSVIAGYDPKDPATAASLGVAEVHKLAQAGDAASLSGVRIGVIRELMAVHTRADEESVHVAEQALADLKAAGAILVDPGEQGSLFADAIAELMPVLDMPAVRQASPASSMGGVDEALEIARDPASLPAGINLRVLGEREPPGSGELLFALNRYLQQRGDRNIRDVADLISKSVSYAHRPIEGVSAPPGERLQMALTREQKLKRLRDGEKISKSIAVRDLDISGWHSARTALQAIINKVMADHRLDALVYPTKTIPSPLLGWPMEPINLKVVKTSRKVMVDGEECEQVVEQVVDLRAVTTSRLGPNAGFPTVVVPAGFTMTVHDRAPVRNADGSVSAGEFLAPKSRALPVTLDFLGCAFSEAKLIAIASAYERVTRHRRPPADFGKLTSHQHAIG